MTQNYKEQIVDINTGEVVWRDLTAQEIAFHKEAEMKRIKEQQELANKAAARLAILEKLGLTAEEAEILLG